MARTLTRKETIVEMLRYYNQAEETLHLSDVGVGARESRHFEMPRDWNRSYRELERCLALLKAERPSQHWHVVQRYLRAEERLVRDVPVRRNRKGAEAKIPHHSELVAVVELGTKTASVRVRSWSPKVDNQKVDKGVEFLSQRFRGEPFLPREILEVVAA